MSTEVSKTEHGHYLVGVNYAILVVSLAEIEPRRDRQTYIANNGEAVLV